jgi:CheY-like chemotaxis protein
MVRTRRPSRHYEGAILVVDDEPSILDVACQLLEHAGFRAHRAASGPEALRIFAEQSDRIDCVILDSVMPEMDGKTTLDALYRVREDVPVILSSGDLEDEVRRRLGGAEIAGFIPKPYSLQDLEGTVRQALDRNA